MVEQQVSQDVILFAFFILFLVFFTDRLEATRAHKLVDAIFEFWIFHEH